MKRKPLFRQQAIDHQRERLVGDVILTQTISGRTWTLVIGVFLMASVLFLALSSFTRKRRVQGYLVPDEGTIEIYPPRDGFVVTAPVEIGDTVAMGDSILEVSDNRALESGKTLESAFSETLEAQRQLLSQKLRWLDSGENRRRRFLGLRIQNLKSRTERLLEQSSIQAEHLALAERRYRTLAMANEEGVVSDEELQRHHERYLIERKNLKQLELSRLEAATQLEESELERTLLEGVTQTQVIDLQLNISALEQQLMRHKGEHRYVITAPAAGRVASLQVQRGQRVHPGSPVMVIIPELVEMKADLFVPTNAIGFVEKGLAVNIQYDAFPYERFGVYPAAVDFVSQAVLRPSQLEVPLRIGEPVYRVRASLEHDEIRSRGRRFPLQPGMRFEADILVESRPLLHWLFAPVLSVKEAL